VLNPLVGDPKKVFESSLGQIWEAIRALVKRAIKSGDIRKDLDPIDLLRRRQRGSQLRLAAKRSEARGYPDHRLAAWLILGMLQRYQATPKVHRLETGIWPF